MSNIKRDIVGVHRAIICKKCGHKVGTLKMKPALQDLLDKKNRKETWMYIFMIALTTQVISDIIINIFRWLL